MFVRQWLLNLVEFKILRVDLRSSVAQLSLPSLLSLTLLGFFLLLESLSFEFVLLESLCNLPNSGLIFILKVISRAQSLLLTHLLGLVLKPSSVGYAPTALSYSDFVRISIDLIPAITLLTIDLKTIERGVFNLHGLSLSLLHFLDLLLVLDVVLKG